MTAPSTARRLTIGWGDPADPVLLATHLSRYGPLPGGAATTGLINAVTAAGLTGRGGAGFPTGRKLAAVAGQKGRAIVVANGMDSEPASAKDEALLSRAPHLVLDGAVLAAVAAGADHVRICISRSKIWLIGLLQRAIAERRRAGWDPVELFVHDPPGGYVSSSETALINWLNGNDAKPTAIPPRPFQRGVDRRPTLVSNVETFAHLALIARFGPEWFREVGLPEAPGTMLVTISGAVFAPGVYEVAGGTPLGAALALARPDEQSSTVLVGGYFGTWHQIDHATMTVPLSWPSLRAIGASPGAGVLLVLPPRTCGLAETARVLAWFAGQSAGQCGPCRFGLPAIAEDFAQLASHRPADEPAPGQMIAEDSAQPASHRPASEPAPGHPLTENSAQLASHYPASESVLARLDRRLSVISGRGACAHPDGAVRFAASALTAFAPDVRAHAAGRPCLHAAQAPAPSSVLPIPGPPVPGPPVPGPPVPALPGSGLPSPAYARADPRS